MGTGVATALAEWATGYVPTAQDLDLARRSLVDTLAVTLAARDDPIRGLVKGLPDPARWACLGHVLDFDDLHLPSTAHVSAVCVPAVLAGGGGARGYLAAAGVMARLGTMLGWPHYSRGWHATCTAGAPAAAAGVAVGLGLDAVGTATAIALAIPGAGGVQRAFGTAAKSLQVGFAAEAGVRAARLAAAGAGADPAAVDQWLALLGGDPGRAGVDGSAVPGGLAVKLYPCCYALQRPIAAMRAALPSGAPVPVERIAVRTTESALQPLIHHRPVTGLQGKFSLEYALASVALDGYPRFTDEAVRRPEAQELLRRVSVSVDGTGDGLLSGEATVEVYLRDGTAGSATVEVPPGAPDRPPTPEQWHDKLVHCGPDVPSLVDGVDWPGAATLLRAALGG
jgi:2-methylcitrate dehydratase PrpD